MGTNYYLNQDVCPHCGRGEESIHIGKSSGGWCFSLHVTPEIRTLDDWERLFRTPGNTIDNEYGEPIDPNEMMRIITDRGYPDRDDSYWDSFPEGMERFYANWDEFHTGNHSEPGPRGLLRHQISQWCSGHGEGTWDYLPGEFS